MVASTTALIEQWAQPLDYVVSQTVWVDGEAAGFNNKIYRCLVAHTSNSFQTDFGLGYWDLVKTAGLAGPAGPQGIQGPQGNAGANGANGANGGAGADGLITAIANQSEAEAGTENTKAMTALRTRQAIDFNLIANRASIVANTAALVPLGDHEVRISSLEASNPKQFPTGQQRVNNNIAVAQSILGKDLPGQDGRGNRWELNLNGAKSARVQFEIYREDDAEIRFSTGILLMHNIGGVWYQERESTTIILGGPDGVTFSVLNASPVGTIQYVSDNMVGGNYRAGSYVRFKIKEIEATL